MAGRGRARRLLLGALFFGASACSDPKIPAAMPEVGVHPPGWADSMPTLHGDSLEAIGYDAEACRSCHGHDYDGGLVEVSCRSCHASYPHTTDWADSHPGFLRLSGYDLAACRLCHGADYSIVKVQTSCLDCHLNPGGPEACTTCHGQFAGDPGNLADVAPPEGLDGETDPRTRAVGAHQAHLAYNPLRPASETCRDCHRVPGGIGDPGHLDDGTTAEVMLGGSLALIVTEGGARVPDAFYDEADGTCGNSYCHGNFGLLRDLSEREFMYDDDKIEGNAAVPTWTDPASAACGTCHDLPPLGHDPFDIDQCGTCHGSVVDGTGAIIDPTKHVNGMVNVFNEEYPMF